MTDTPDESERPPDTADASGRSVADAIDATDAPPESVVTAPSIDVTSLLDDALRHASMGVVLVDEAGVIVLATPAAGELLGWELSALVGRSVSVVFDSDVGFGTSQGRKRQQGNGRTDALVSQFVGRSETGAAVSLSGSSFECTHDGERYYCVTISE